MVTISTHSCRFKCSPYCNLYELTSAYQGMQNRQPSRPLSTRLEDVKDGMRNHNKSSSNLGSLAITLAKLLGLNEGHYETLLNLMGMNEPNILGTVVVRSTKKSIEDVTLFDLLSFLSLQDKSQRSKDEFEDESDYELIG